MADDRLDEVLASIGRHLVIDTPAGDLVMPAGDSGGTSSQWSGRRGRLLVAAVIVAVVAASVVSIAPARRVVGGWLRAGRIDVSVDPNMTIEPGLPGFIDAATPIDQSYATTLLGHTPPDLASSSLGVPDGWWTVPEGGVLLTWTETVTSLWMVPTGEHEAGHIDKIVRVADAEHPTWLPDLGNGGIAIDAPHLVLTPQRRVAAGSVVAWDVGGITFRLESTLDIDELVLVAESIAAIE